MTLLDYQVFLEITRLGSFAAAARKMNLTPSAISHAVSGMEEECGFSLFQRGKSGVSLTSGGRRLLPMVQKVLASQEALQQTLSELNGQQRGVVSIGGFNSVCTCWLPPIIRSFRQDHPEISVQVYQGSYEDVAGWLRDGTVDFGFLSEDAAREFEFTPLSRDRLLCVVPDSFEPANTDYITVEEMSGHPFVLQNPGLNTEIRYFIQNHKIDLNIACHVEDDQSSMAMVESGLGICVVPELVLQCFSRPIRSYPIEPAEYRVVGLATVTNTTATPAAQLMMDCIQRKVQEDKL